METSSNTSVVDRRPGLTHEEFLHHYVRNGIPVVIPGAMKNEWSAFSKWDASYFRDQLGHKQAHVGGKKVLMKDFMDTVIASNQSNPSLYLNEVNIHKDFPELLPDITPHLQYALPDRLMSKFLPESWGMRNGIVELLIGGKGTKFPTLHYDGYHMNTFVTQIKGDKEFVFYAPSETDKMYPEKTGSNKSLVNDVFNPDLNRFPKFAEAHRITTTVYEGDTAFLPSGWWHSTRLLSLSIAVSTNAVHPPQWDEFVEDYSEHLGAGLKKAAYKSYLKAAGLMMGLSGG
jgi:histone arginine demethylase JMJD6